MTTSKPNRLTTVAQAAAATGIHPRTLRRWISEGVISAYRIGPVSIRLSLDDVDALLRPIEPTSTPAKSS